MKPQHQTKAADHIILVLKDAFLAATRDFIDQNSRRTTEKKTTKEIVRPRFLMTPDKTGSCPGLAYHVLISYNMSRSHRKRKAAMIMYNVVLPECLYSRPAISRMFIFAMNAMTVRRVIRPSIAHNPRCELL